MSTAIPPYDMTSRVDSTSRSNPVSWESTQNMTEERQGQGEWEQVTEDQVEDVILEEIDLNMFKLTVPNNVSPGDEIEINNGHGKKKLVRIKAGIHAGDVLVVDFNDRETRHLKSTITTNSTALDKPSLTTAFGTVIRKMVNCGCIGDAE
jgi:hypothetical protein